MAYVRVKNGDKLSPKFAGPYRVIERRGLCYKLKNLVTGKELQFHSDDVKPEYVLLANDNPNVRRAFIDKRGYMEETKEAEVK